MAPTDLSLGISPPAVDFLNLNLELNYHRIIRF